MYRINLGLMISTDDLRFFVTLAASRSLAAAARALNVTPPAVTQRLRLMEERLGLRLVDRSGRHRRPAPQVSPWDASARGCLHPLAWRKLMPKGIPRRWFDCVRTDRASRYCGAHLCRS